MAFEFTYYFLRGAMHTRSPTHDVANVVGWLVGHADVLRRNGWTSRVVA